MKIPNSMPDFHILFIPSKIGFNFYILLPVFFKMSAATAPKKQLIIVIIM